MVYISAAGVLFGVAQSRRLRLGLFVLLAITAATWLYILNFVAGFSFLHSLREGIYGAWSAEAGAFAGLLLDRLVLRGEP